jgi:ABC-type dipeptide/oligopeptide/nickel transport system ATPase component
MIAIALACNPEILIADEPTTALDVTVQAQILELINKLQKELGMGVIMITHDLGVIAEVSNKVCVMYASKVAEYGPVKEIFKNPKLTSVSAAIGRPRPAATSTSRFASTPAISSS